MTAQNVIGIEAQRSLTPRSDIVASSTFGQQGLVTVRTPETEVETGVSPLPDNVSDPSAQFSQSLCEEEGNSFVASGRGGLPSSPDDISTGDIIWEDWNILPGLQERRKVPSSAAPRSAAPVNIQLEEGKTAPLHREAILEARSWRVNQQDDIALVTTPAEASFGDSIFRAAACEASA